MSRIVISTKALYKRDILIGLVCIVFLLMNLAAVGSRGRSRAKEVVCLSNLRQWGTVFQIFSNDNDGYFLSGQYNGTWSGAGKLVLVIIRIDGEGIVSLVFVGRYEAAAFDDLKVRDGL